MKLKFYEKGKVSIKPLTVRKTLIKSITNNSELPTQSNNTNNPKTKITINKTLLWKDQDRSKTERNSLPFTSKIKQEIKKQKKENSDYTKIVSSIKRNMEFSNSKIPQIKLQNNIIKKINLNSITISPKGSNDKIIKERYHTINNISPVTQTSSQMSHSPGNDNRNNYRFLLHQVSKNLTRTFSKLYEANNRSFSSPANNNNGNLIKNGSEIFSNKKELSKLGYNINNRGNSMLKSNSNSNLNLKNKIYENQINVPIIKTSPRGEYNTISTENTVNTNNKSNHIYNHKRALSSYNQNIKNNPNMNNKRTLTEGNENYFFEKNQLDFMIEYLFILENKLKDVLCKLNVYQPCYNECFEWINFYFNSNVYNYLIKQCKDSNNRKLMTYAIKIELLCYCLCYNVSYDRNLNKVVILLKSIFEQIHFNFLVIVRFILHKSKMTYENYVWYEKLYNIVKNELSMNLTKDDLDEHHIMQIIHHNVKTIGNYFKIIIDNLYSETYHPNIKQYKFPFTLNNMIDKEKNKNKIISSFFFDAYTFTDNYTIEDIDRFFNLFLYKVTDPNASYILSYRVKFPEEGSPIFISNNQNVLNQKPLFYLPKMNTKLYKFTLVLDLDETLVFIKQENNNNRVLILRPYLFEFLERMKNLYELILFSYGTPEYVDPIVNILEKNTKYFEYRLYRQHTYLNGDDYVKDLNKLGRDLKKVVIVDNLPQAFKLQKSNGICIKAFYGDSIGDRNTLKVLSEVLERIRYDAEESNDIRESIKKENHIIITRITSNVDY